MRNDPYGLWGRTRWRREASGRLVPMEDDTGRRFLWATAVFTFWACSWGLGLFLVYVAGYAIGSLFGWLFHGS